MRKKRGRGRLELALVSTFKLPTASVDCLAHLAPTLAIAVKAKIQSTMRAKF